MLYIGFFVGDYDQSSHDWMFLQNVRCAPRLAVVLVGITILHAPGNGNDDLCRYEQNRQNHPNLRDFPVSTPT